MVQHMKKELEKLENKRFILFECIVLMILPQVHLRKPCYDFYFL